MRKVKKPQGGQLGNMNSVRNPWTVFFRRCGLREEDRWLTPLIERYESDLKADKPDLTRSELQVVQLAKMSRGAVLLIWREALREGIITKDDKGWDLHRGFKELRHFIGRELDCLKALGLEARPREIDQDIAKSLQLIERDENEIQEEDEDKNGG